MTIPEVISFYLAAEKSIKPQYKKKYTLFVNNNVGTGNNENYEYIPYKNTYSDTYAVPYIDFYKGSVFYTIDRMKDLSEPIFISDDSSHIDYIVDNVDNDCADLLFHLYSSYFIHDDVYSLDFDAYKDISPRYSAAMVLVEYALKSPGFYRNLISSVAPFMKAKKHNPTINSLNVATLLLSYGEDISSIVDFFKENYGIDNQLKELDSFSPGDIRSTILHNDDSFLLLHKWQKTTCRKYAKDLDRCIPEFAFSSVFLLDFFLHCNDEGVNVLPDVKDYIEMSQYRIRKCEALPFAHNNGNPADLDFRNFNDSFYSRFISQQEYDNALKDVKTALEDVRGEFYLQNDELLAFVRGIIALYAIFLKNNPDTLPFALLRHVMI